MTESPQSKGGKARSAKLTPADRSRIAKDAAAARWEEKLPSAVSGHDDRPIRIGDIKVPCFVLDDGRRVITTVGILDTLQMARGGSMRKGMNRLELFVSGSILDPFISPEIKQKITNPIKFRIDKNIAHGFESDTLIDIAEAVVKADNKGVLQPQQIVIAHQCRVITSSLTRLGLIALIDEATGHQSKRDQDELQSILSAYILPEHRNWMQTIPAEFTSEIYRVYGWKRNSNNRGPRYAGKLIRKLIYEQMPKPVLPELDNINPSNDKYQRKYRHHQFLTDQQGLDHFRSLVITVMTLLRVSKNKNQFTRHINSYFGGQDELDLGD